MPASPIPMGHRTATRFDVRRLWPQLVNEKVPELKAAVQKCQAPILVAMCLCIHRYNIEYTCTYTHANKSHTFFETRHQSVHYQFWYPGPVFQQSLPIVKLKLVGARNNKSFPRSCKGAPRPSPSAGWFWWTHIPWGGLDRGILKEQMMLMNIIRLSSGDRSTLLSLSLMYRQNWPARDFGKEKVLWFLIFQFLACVHDVSEAFELCWQAQKIETSPTSSKLGWDPLPAMGQTHTLQLTWAKKPRHQCLWLQVKAPVTNLRLQNCHIPLVQPELDVCMVHGAKLRQRQYIRPAGYKKAPVWCQLRYGALAGLG